MQLKLIGDWRWVLQKAWSAKLMLLASVLSGLDSAMQYIAPHYASWRFAAAAAAISAIAFCVRFLCQRDDK